MGAHLWSRITDTSKSHYPVELGYHFTTNTGTGGHEFFPIDKEGDSHGTVDRDIAFQLQLGQNRFHFDLDQFAKPRYALNLYFDDSPTPLVVGPDILRGEGFASDLTVFSDAGSGVFSIPSSGTLVGSYGADLDQHNGEIPVAYSGAAHFQVSGLFLHITDFQIDNLGSPGGPTGLFEITVSEIAPIPEPSTILLLGTGLAGLVGYGRRKRKAQEGSIRGERVASD